MKKVVKEPFRNQDKIVTSIVKNLCGTGGLPIWTVEQEWFRDFMKLVEPRFESVSRVGVNSKLEEIYARERSKLLAEIKASPHPPVNKPTVTCRIYVDDDACFVSHGELIVSKIFYLELHVTQSLKFAG